MDYSDLPQLSKDIVNLLIQESSEARKEILKRFCRVCGKYVGSDTDWSGKNYCNECSPDSKE